MLFQPPIIHPDHLLPPLVPRSNYNILRISYLRWKRVCRERLEPMPAASCFVHSVCPPRHNTRSLQNNYVITRSSLYGFSGKAWRGLMFSGIRTTKLDPVLTGFRVRCFSTQCARASRLPEVNPHSSVKEESDSFYVVRKGDIIGIYKSLSDCQAQVSSSICDPSVSVYKGLSFRKETEEYFTSQGLKNALYSMKVANVKEDLFGTLVPCPFQHPNDLDFVVDTSPEETSSQHRAVRRAKCLHPNDLDFVVDTSPEETSSQHRAVRRAKCLMTCIIEYDGASKGNPGNSGAGAILRTEDGSVIYRLRQGLGVVTNNVAEYRALILAMKFALKKGFKQIRVQGDSKLVCMQVNGTWRTKNQNMADLCKEVKGLKDCFTSFKISHVMREFNSDADAQANLAVALPDGQVYEDCGETLSA